MIGALIKLLLVGVAAVVVLGVVLGIVGMLFGLAFGLVALAFKLAPLVLVGYVIFKLVERGNRRRGQISAGDRAWLDS
jgi:hypothetical protein